MPDFTVRSDSVDVEQLMEQIRARIREKRGVDYTEQQIKDLAAVKLEKFLDPTLVRSDLLQQFRKIQGQRAGGSAGTEGAGTPAGPQRGPIMRKIYWFFGGVMRRMFRPVTRTIIELNNAEHRANADMYFELFHNLVVELTRTGIEVKNLKMRVESLTGRLEFNERRARALESVVVYRPSDDDVKSASRPVEVSRSSEAPVTMAPISQGSSQTAGGGGPQGTSTGAPGGQPGDGPGQRSRRRRRRRGRRGGGSAAAMIGGAQPPPAGDTPATQGAQEHEGPDGFDGPDDDSSDPGPSEP